MEASQLLPMTDSGLLRFPQTTNRKPQTQKSKHDNDAAVVEHASLIHKTKAENNNRKKTTILSPVYYY
jgi:hypothetical protein